MIDHPWKLLLIDSDPADAELASKLLKQAFADCQCITVNDAVAFAEQLAVGGFSAIISEQKLGWARGTDVLAAFSRQYPGTRTILFAASLPADTRKLQQQVGLSAWLQKSSSGFLRLPEVVRSMLQSPRPTEGSQEFWSQTIKRLDEAALTILADGSVVESNAAAATVLGYHQADDLAGLGLTSLFDLDPHFLAGDQDLLTRLAALVKGLDEPLGIRAAPINDVHKIGLRQLTIWPIPGSPHLAVLYQGHKATAPQIATDSDFREQHEQLLYAVSHDLQEPLQLVSRHANLLQDAYKEALDDTGLRFVQNLVGNTRLMQSMLDDLLEYSRIGRLEPIVTEVDLNKVVGEVLALYRPKLQEIGGIVRKAGLPTLLADRGQMIRLFQNLIGNAIKFHSEKKPVITISAIDNDDSWELTVQDNGIGMEPEQLNHVFTMFKRLHTEDEIPGNGMGLALCERIVAAYGGQIWVRPGGRQYSGVTIHFTLKKTGLAQREPDQARELETGVRS